MSKLAKVLSGPGLSENDLIPENGRGFGAKEQNIAFIGPRVFTNKQQNGGDDPGPQVYRHPSPGVREEELGEV